MMEKNDLIEDCLLNLKGLFKNLAEDFKQYKVECSNLEQIITTLKVRVILIVILYYYFIFYFTILDFI